MYIKDLKMSIFGQYSHTFFYSEANQFEHYLVEYYILTLTFCYFMTFILRNIVFPIEQYLYFGTFDIIQINKLSILFCTFFDMNFNLSIMHCSPSHDNDCGHYYQIGQSSSTSRIRCFCFCLLI